MNVDTGDRMDLFEEALARFGELFARGGECGLNEPSAMTLATADADGRPSARTVLLKGAGADGFVFYTNTTSRKGAQLAANPHAALCLFWQPLMEQVLVEGDVAPVADAEADAYWAGRPRESQVGGWASDQSATLDARDTLVRRVADVEARFAGRPVPRPPHWSGYRLRPRRIEFWKSMPHRLHERVLYARSANGWTRTMLNP